jgi:hypothetical protein
MTANTVLSVNVPEDHALQRLGEDSGQSLQDRLQKSLRIRKNAQKTLINQDGQIKPITQIMSNYSEVKTGAEVSCKSANYQRELNNKVVQAISKGRKEGSNSRGGQAKSAKPKFIGDLPKTKSFAENLMNMLAKQKVG